MIHGYSNISSSFLMLFSSCSRFGALKSRKEAIDMMNKRPESVLLILPATLMFRT